MDKKIHIDITRAAAGRMASRLRDFLSKRGTDLRQSSAYQVIAIMLGYRDWNTMSAELDPEEDRYSDEALENWRPAAFENRYDALNSEGAVVVAIPSADKLLQAVADVRALWKEDRDQGRYLVLADDPAQWVQEDDDFYTVVDFPQEWRHDRHVGVNQLIDLRFSKHIIVSVADVDMLSFVAEAALSTIDCWCFVVADTFSDAAQLLIRSDTYIDLGGSNDVSILMWPFEKAGQIRDNGSWRRPLRSQLEARDAVAKARWPLHALSKADFDKTVDAVEEADAQIRQFEERRREANPGKTVFTFDDDAPIDSLDGVVRLRTILEGLNLLALVDMRALIRLGLGWDEAMSWSAVLGKAHRDLARTTRKPSEFVESTSGLSRALVEGLRIAREIAV